VLSVKSLSTEYPGDRGRTVVAARDLAGRTDFRNVTTVTIDGEHARDFDDAITIESLQITDVAIVYGDFHIFKVWALDQKPALIIGMDVLGTVASLSIDFKNQDVYVEGLRNVTHSMPVTHGDINNMAIRR